MAVLGVDWLDQSARVYIVSLAGDRCWVVQLVAGSGCGGNASAGRREAYHRVGSR